MYAQFCLCDDLDITMDELTGNSSSQQEDIVDDENEKPCVNNVQM